MIELNLEGDATGVFELAWDSVAEDEWKAARKEIIRDRDKVAVVPVTDEAGRKVYNIGRLGSDEWASYSKKERKALVSVAALLGHSNPDANLIAVESITGKSDQYWLCAVSHGQVLTGTDVIGDFETIATKVMGLRGIMDASTQKIIGGSASLFDDGAEGEPVSAFLDDSLIKKALIGQPPGSGVGAKEIATGVVFTGMVAFWGVLLFGGEDSDRQPQKSAQQIKQEEIARAEAAMDTHLQELAQLPRIIPASLEHHKKVTGLPVSVGGWSLVKVDCGPSQCGGEYSDETITGAKALSTALAHDCDPLFDPQGKTALCSVTRAEVATNQQTTEITVTPSVLADMRERMMTVARSIEGAGYRVGEPSPISFQGREVIGKQSVPVVVEVALDLPISTVRAVVPYVFEGAPVLFAGMNYDLNSKSARVTGELVVDGGKQ